MSRRGRIARAPSRRASRKRALDLLYQADLTGRPPAILLAAALREEPWDDPFAESLVRGVAEHREDLDAELGAHATGWTVDRMPIVDRNLLRLGLFELRHLDDIPDAVAISEAVALAEELSTDASGRFVNGLLARLTEARVEPVAEPGPDQGVAG